MAVTVRLLVVLCLSVGSFYCAFSLAGACDVKFFGPECKYECQCLTWDSCDKEKDCSVTKGCIAGFGGPACQYVNLAFNQTVNTQASIKFGHSFLSYIVDGKPQTCILEEGVSGHPVSVDVSYETLTDRVTVLLYEDFARNENFTNVNQIETTVYKEDGSSELLDAHLPNADDVLVTYRLSTPARVSRVEVRAVGQVSLALCEISVLAGRNVALRRNTTIRKATTGGNSEATGTAPQVVDGSDTTCSQGNEDASWRVPLGQGMKIWRIRTHAKPQGGVNIAVNDTVLQQPLETSDFIVGPYNELCEIEIYGDCPDGYFGWDCDKRCQCDNPSEICDTIHGFCPQSGCRRGYTGNCTQECPLGTFGRGCAWNCSAACVDDDCNHVTGKCTNGCKQGMDEGSECRESCQPGFYGKECDQTCSEGCRDDVCDDISGYCHHGCKPGTTGKSCTPVSPSRTDGGEGLKASLLLAITAALSTVLHYC